MHCHRGNYYRLCDRGRTGSGEWLASHAATANATSVLALARKQICCIKRKFHIFNKRPTCPVVHVWEEERVPFCCRVGLVCHSAGDKHRSTHRIAVEREGSDL